MSSETPAPPARKDESLAPTALAERYDRMFQLSELRKNLKALEAVARKLLNAQILKQETKCREPLAKEVTHATLMVRQLVSEGVARWLADFTDKSPEQWAFNLLAETMELEKRLWPMSMDMFDPSDDGGIELYKKRVHERWSHRIESHFKRVIEESARIELALCIPNRLADDTAIRQLRAAIRRTSNAIDYVTKRWHRCAGFNLEQAADWAEESRGDIFALTGLHVYSIPGLNAEKWAFDLRMKAEEASNAVSFLGLFDETDGRFAQITAEAKALKQFMDSRQEELAAIEGLAAREDLALQDRSPEAVEQDWQAASNGSHEKNGRANPHTPSQHTHNQVPRATSRRCRITAQVAGKNGQLGDGADGRADGFEKKELTFPRNPKVLALIKLLKKERPSGRSDRDIALQFTEGREREADSLLRKVRAYRHLFDRLG